MKRSHLFNYLLLIVMNMYLIGSVVTYFGHTPNWFILLLTGAITVVLHLYPVYARLSILTVLFVIVLIMHFYDPFQVVVFDFVRTIMLELGEWDGIYDFPGAMTTLIISILYMLVFVFVQLKFITRGNNNAWMIAFGSGVYLWLWFQFYSHAEKDLLIFLFLAFPTAAIFHFEHRVPTSKSWYKIGLLGLSVVTFTAVSVMPNEIGPITYQQGHDFVKQNMPFLLELRTREKSPIVLGEGKEVPGEGEVTEGAGIRTSGYQPGGVLGGGLTESNVPVLDIQLESGALPLSLYLRGHVSDYYTGNRWENRRADEVAELEEGFTGVELYDRTLEITVSPYTEQESVFGLFPTHDIEFQSKEQNYRVDAFGNIEPEDDNYDEYYTLTGKMITDQDLEEIDPQDEVQASQGQLEAFLQLPDALPSRVRELSHDITEGAENELEKIYEVKEYLAQFPYTRDTPELPEGEDFVDHFLFDLEQGYCTYYASAMAVLLRIQEIPTRYVEGFRVPLYPDEEELELRGIDEYDISSMTARQNHAHAWVEIFLEDYGWVVFEPTQPYDILGGNGEPDLEDEVSDSDQETEKLGKEKTTGFKGWGGTSWYGFIMIPLAVVLITGGTLAVKDFIQVKGPQDLYYKVVTVYSVYYYSPKPEDTPQRVIKRIQKAFPSLITELEKVATFYQEYYYSNYRKESPYFSDEKGMELKALPIKMLKLYYHDMGLIAAIKYNIIIFGRIVLDKWVKREYDN